MLYTAYYHSPFGKILLAAKENALVGLWFEGQKYYLSSFREEMVENPKNPALLQAVSWLEDYFAKKQPPTDRLPLSPIGSPFRQTVWQILLEIPYGSTTTYAEVARKAAAKMGLPHMSAQATGGAVAHNPISVIIPCHRVVGSNGSLTGYAGGMEKKLLLLHHEGVDTTQYFMPRNTSADNA